MSEGTFPSTLPTGWARARLDEVAEVQGGIQKQQKRRPVENKYPFLRVANVSSGRLDLREVHEVELFEGELDRFSLIPGDLLVVEGNGSISQLGRAARWNGEIKNCVHQNHLIRVRPGSAILGEFLELLWNSPIITEQIRQVAASTSGLHTLSTAKLKKLEIPLPPVAEQQRIVSALEEQISRLDAAEISLSDVYRRITLTLRSVLNQFFTPSEAIERGWQLKRLENVAEIRGGQTPRKDSVTFSTEWSPGLLPFWKVGDMNSTDGRTLERSRTYISREQAQGASLRVQPAGTVVIPKRGGAISTNKKRITAIAGAFDLNTMGIIPNEGLVSEFLWYWFQTINLQDLADGSNVPQINRPDLSHLMIPVPGISEQRRVVDRLDIIYSRLHQAQGMTERVSPKLLRNALLRDAFVGRLVAQDATDEPAEVLLARLQAAQQAADTSKPRRRRASVPRKPQSAPAPASPAPSVSPVPASTMQPTLDLEIPS